MTFIKNIVMYVVIGGIFWYIWGWWKIQTCKKLMLHINVEDILCSSRIILTARLSDHGKTFFGGLAFTHFIQET